MQVELWKALLLRVPSDQIDNLMLMTTQGTEINVQALLRMEEDFMVLRGRQAGTNDGGRVFILPYERLDFIGFQKPLSDAQLLAVFEDAPASATPPPAPAAPAAAPAPVVAAPVAATPAAQGTTNGGLLARMPSRSKIIQRLRLRTEARDSADSPRKE
jgi:hypothetical protein